MQLLEKLIHVPQQTIDLPPVAQVEQAEDETLDEQPLEPSNLAGTKTGAIILGVLGALWLSYIGYLNANED